MYQSENTRQRGEALLPAVVRERTPPRPPPLWKADTTETLSLHPPKGEDPHRGRPTELRPNSGSFNILNATSQASPTEGFRRKLLLTQILLLLAQFWSMAQSLKIQPCPITLSSGICDFRTR